MHSNRIAIEYRRPRIAGARPHLHGFANDRQQFDRIHKHIHLSTCASITDMFNNNDTITANATQLRATLIFNWTMTINSDHHHVTSGNECSIDWKAPIEGEYRVRVRIYSNLLPHKLLMSGARSIVIRDLWIVALGDSFASGEGNPELPMQGLTPARWLSDACHRSSHAWTYKTYEMIAEKYANYGIIFTFLACTGASIDNGVLTSTGDTNHRSQFDMILELVASRHRSPDLVLVSVGGNDVGYADILNSDAASFADIDMRFFYLSHQLDRLADAFANRLKLSPNAVIFPHYFDPTRNERGVIDANCVDLRAIGSEALEFAEKHILRRINAMISRRVDRWTPVDGVTRIFERGGICSKRPMIVSVRESERRQGNAMGAYHPVADAHEKISRLVWRQIETMFD